MQRRRFASSLVLVLAASTCVSDVSALPTTPRAPVRGGASLAFVQRPGSHHAGVTPPSTEASVLVRFAAKPSPADLAALEATGAAIVRHGDGSPSGVGRSVLARVTKQALDKASGLPGVERISLDGRPFSPPRPLDATAVETQMKALWPKAKDGTGGLTGQGVTICDVDGGIDVFHPLFWRADGGYRDWVDVDGDDVFSPGIDAVDLDRDGAPEILRVLDMVVTSFYDDEPQFGTDDPGYELGFDWLYADKDGSGAREFGTGAGFTEQDPTFGEPVFVADDVNGNGKLDLGERIVALGTSKIRAVRVGSKVYERGTNLIQTMGGNDVEHGTGAAGVLAGGNLGFTKLVGMAPDAELLMAVELQGGQEFTMTDWCIDRGARVVLHEYATWTGYHLDGSEELEQLIDASMAQGIAHINPAGNLSTADKLYKSTIPKGVETVVPIEASPSSSYGPFHFLVLTLLWRDTTRSPSIVLEDPTGTMHDVSGNPPVSTGWDDELEYYAERENSSRGTSKVDIYLYDSANGPVAIPSGTYKLRIKDDAPADQPDLELVAYVMDEASGWGKGVHFPEHASEDHLVGYPGTADHSIAVSAYTGHGFLFGNPGERAWYSGRGHRIDGLPLISVSAPDDPITSGWREGTQAAGLIYGGTSGSSPHVAGAAALLLQAEPARTGDDVRALLREGAAADDLTGAVPNDDFGFGKMRVYRSLYGKDPETNTPPVISVEPVTAHVGEKVEVKVSANDPDEDTAGLAIALDRDYDGAFEEQLAGPSFPVTFEATGRYVSKVRVTDARGAEAVALAIIDVLPPEPPGDVLLVAGGGGGCSASPGPMAPVALAPFAFIGLGLGWMRRRRLRARTR
jgi:MYXO-CTERM domain-containing protein